MNSIRQRLVVALLLIVAAAVFTTGINWGLPSRQEDKYLLGADYHGMHLEALTGQIPQVDATRGADVVAPSGPADQVVPLNDTNLKKAQILCRYRLYSFQPDEMITFRSLSQMNPAHGELDPRLYQYGGLWIYPVGAIIQAGHLLGFLDVGNRTLYIANPLIFGKFYIAARAYCAAWGLVGAWAVYVLIRRMTGGNIFLSAAGTISFIFMPVVVDMAHEAKPHLPGMVLILLAILAGDNYLRTQRTKWIWITGMLCGASAGMVLWGIIGLVLLPVIAWLAKRPVAILHGLAAAIVVYAATNPYVIFHLFHDPSVLRSNLGNTSAMYQLGRPDRAIWNAFQLIVAGCGLVVVITGLIGTILFFQRQKQPPVAPSHSVSSPSPCTQGEGRGGGLQVAPSPIADQKKPSPYLSPGVPRAGTNAGILLFAAAVATLIPFTFMAAGKPGEYARFALLPDAALAIAATSWPAFLKSRVLRAGLSIFIAAGTICYGIPYLVGFIRDSRGFNDTSRQIVAEEINRTLISWRQLPAMYPTTPSLQTRKWILGVYSDPAPYCLPPVDLDRWTIVRLPRNYDEANGRYAADLIVRPDESLDPWLPGRTPISWANKHFDLIEGGAYDVWSPGDP
jgi:hypothetical protein